MHICTERHIYELASLGLELVFLAAYFERLDERVKVLPAWIGQNQACPFPEKVAQLLKATRSEILK